MNRTLSISFVLAVGLAVGTPAQAKPKVTAAAAGGPTACGFKSMPLAVGNTWTYKAGPAQIVLKITAVGPGKDWNGKAATVIDVEELYAGRTVKTSLSCTAGGGLYVPPDSFLFSGEPGGGVGTQFNVTSHDRPWLVPEEQLVGDVAWVEVVKAEATRPDTAASGAQNTAAKVELERHAQLKGNETVTIGIGQFSAEKVAFELRGRATIDDQKAEVPIKRPATMWYTKGIGLVKIEDAFDKTWELAESSLISAK